MLPRNLRQEALSRAYVRAVAAQAGVICGNTENDLSFDLLLRAVEFDGHQYWDSGPQLDVQLKSTTHAEVRGNEVAYDLDVRAYNLLREPQPFRPRILILLVLPADEPEWLQQSEEGLTLRRCAYWLSLRGVAATTAYTSIRITFPRSQVFSVETLRHFIC